MPSPFAFHFSLAYMPLLLLLTSLSLSNRRMQSALKSPSRLALVIVSTVLPIALAQVGGVRNFNGTVFQGNDKDIHLISDDNYIGNAQASFFVDEWMRRGVAIRGGGSDAVCYDSLIATLNSIVNIRLAEYAGAAGVLSLLPTIGALLGAPTNEIWRLLTVIPFGGVLTILISFGGAILPIKIEDYERDIAKGNGLIGKIVSFRQRFPGEMETDSEGLEGKLVILREKLRQRIARPYPRRPIHGTLMFGLAGMGILLLGAHAAMAIVEQGGVLPWFCTSRYWMHLWYLMVTITAIAENYSQLPFDQQWRLFVSDVPYNIDIVGGDDILDQLQINEDGVSTTLDRLARLRAGKVLIRGSIVDTKAINTVIIMVSVAAKDQTFKSVLRLFTKMSSIGVFVTGTAFFAAVQLMALPMAVMVLTLILAAGVFGRGFANWIVTQIDREEPLIHIIVEDAKEAHEVICAMLELDYKKSDGELERSDKQPRLIQVEIGGHIFIKHRRVAKRRSWYVSAWGIMANPFDLRKVGKIVEDDHHHTGYDHHTGYQHSGYQPVTYGKGTGYQPESEGKGFMSNTSSTPTYQPLNQPMHQPQHEDEIAMGRLPDH